MSSRPELSVGAVVVDGRDRLLLIRRGNPPGVGLWSIPGGRVEFGETMAEAIVRELNEETGLEGVCGEMLGWVERITDENHFVIADFRVHLLDDDTPLAAGDDAAEAEWVPVNDVAERSDLVDGLAEFLHQVGIIPTLI